MTLTETLATATDLQRKAARVLDDAARGPVSIQRPNKPAITLVRRETWHDAALAKWWLSLFSAVVRYVVERAKGEPESAYPSELPWLRIFANMEDLRDFVDELSIAMHAAVSGIRPWDEVDAVVEEWRRSAAALDDEHLRARFGRVRGT